MIGFLEGLMVTLKSTLRRPVTAQYPDPKKRLQVANRFMGFPALTWDSQINEPYCTGCMLCIRNCPTQCMTAEMKDNPLNAEGLSSRRKIIDTFEINLGRCILCAICVDVCNFDAIEMSYEHERSDYFRNGNRVDLPQLLEMGKTYQVEANWSPKQPEKNSGVPKEAPARAKSATTDTKPAEEMTKEERLAAARARAAAKREGTAEAVEAPAQTPTKEERLAAARARAAAKSESAVDAGDASAQPASNEDRLAAARARAAAKSEVTAGAGDAPAQPVSNEERLAAARARAAAKREITADAGDAPAQPVSNEERLAAARARAAAKRQQPDNEDDQISGSNGAEEGERSATEEGETN